MIDLLIAAGAAVVIVAALGLVVDAWADHRERKAECPICQQREQR